MHLFLANDWQSKLLHMEVPLYITVLVNQILGAALSLCPVSPGNFQQRTSINFSSRSEEKRHTRSFHKPEKPR